MLVTTATATFLQDAYGRMPLLVPVRFEDGSPMWFAFKSPSLVYLPVALQLALGIAFTAVVYLVLRRSRRTENDGGLRAAGARQTAEGIALLALVWIAFQAANAWRLAALYQRTFDTGHEVYTLALITAITVTVVIGTRVVLQVRDSEGRAGVNLDMPVLADRRLLASAALAAALGFGLAAPVYLVAAVWGGLRHI